MLRRFASGLLVLLVLANQGLCLAPVDHNHDGAEPEHHDSLPHFHLAGQGHHKGGHHKHGHGDERHQERGHGGEHHERSSHFHSDRPYEGPSPETPSPETPSPEAPCSAVLSDDSHEHDSDAVYCGEALTVARTSNTSDQLPEKALVGSALVQLAVLDDAIGRLRSPWEPLRSDVSGALPIYLRTLSLRL